MDSVCYSLNHTNKTTDGPIDLFKTVRWRRRRRWRIIINVVGGASVRASVCVSVVKNRFPERNSNGGGGKRRALCRSYKFARGRVHRRAHAATHTSAQTRNRHFSGRFGNRRRARQISRNRTRHGCTGCLRRIRAGPKSTDLV